MNCDADTKMTGVNTWFLIEIFSFYGYIMAAMITILINIVKSSCGYLDKEEMKERHEYDFMIYHEMDIIWAAFV